MSSMSESATSATTSTLRNRRREVLNPPSPCVLRPPAFSVLLRSTRDGAQSRRQAEEDAREDDDANVNASTPPSIRSPSRRGMLPGLMVRTT